MPMTLELYTSAGVDCVKLLEPKWSNPPTDAEEESNGASKQDRESACENAKIDLPIIIHDSDSSVSSDSGSSDSREPISRKARKLAIKKAKKIQASQPKGNITNFFVPISSAMHMSNVNAQMAPDIMNLWSVVPIETSRDLVNSEAPSTTDGSSSSSCSPAERRNGYILDDFVVASSDSDNEDDDEVDEDDDV